MINQPAIKCVAYSRFSPRPLQAVCRCGHQFVVEATEKESILAVCPACQTTVTVRNSESCESQLADVREYCRKQAYELVSEHSDKALSGSDDCRNRPALFDAKIACKRGYRLVVRNLDRLFRDMEKAALFRAEMNAKGVKTVSVEQPEANGETSTGKLMTAIYDWVAEIRREEIRARTRTKMLEHQRNGRKMSSRPPYGFEVDAQNPKKLVRNPTEQSYIKTIKDLHRQGMTFRQIARWLEDAGVPRRGKPTWTHQLVQAILVREGLVTSPSTSRS